jgi:Mn-dependent DtxR family transcriptional regulator
MKCSKQLSVKMQWGEHRLLSGFLYFKHGVTSVEDCEYSGCLSTGRTDKTAKKLSKIIDKDGESTISDIVRHLV